jgi:UDP-2,3-diacylglucosamine pyrophosphatase LpxH
MELRPFELAWIVSDLHIGGTPGSQMFQCGSQFKALIDQILKEHQELRAAGAGMQDAQCLLVINGDFIDFLAQNPPAFFSLKDSVSMLQSILQEPAFRPVTKALQDFTAAEGTHLVVVLGNHDLELALPDCRQQFLQTITSGKPERRGKVELCFEGWGYRFSVAGRRALCLHGNETDPWNFTRYDELDRIQREMMIHGDSPFGRNWMPSAGTQFVIRAVNPIKAEFPFVDLMHPLFPLLTTVLGILDPGNITYVDDFAAAAAKAKANDLTRPQSQRRMLSAGALTMDGEIVRHDSSAEEIIRATEAALRNGTIDELIANDGTDLLFMDGWIKSMKSAASAAWDKTIELKNRTVKSLTDAGKRIHCETLRRALLPIVQETPETPEFLSSEDKAIERAIGGTYDVVFAGHTHSQRFASRHSGKGFYVNTGTWADRITLLKKDLTDSQEFQGIYDALIGQPNETPEEARRRLHDTKRVRQECPAACLRLDKAGSGVVVELWQPRDAAGQPITFTPQHQQQL